MRRGQLALLLLALAGCGTGATDYDPSAESDNDEAIRRVCPDGTVRLRNKCVPECGDGTCVGAETCGTCALDCGECAASCGDGVCDPGEDCTSCGSDCGECPPSCGDGLCDATENCTSCASDCGGCTSVTQDCSPNVALGADLDTVVNGAAAGATLCLPAGMFRIDHLLEPKAGVSVIGQKNADGSPATVINASKSLGGATWTTGSSGGVPWWRTSFTQGPSRNLNDGFNTFDTFSTPGGVGLAHPQAKYCDDVFVNDQLVTRAASLAVISNPGYREQVDTWGPGKFYIDYTNDYLYLSVDPTKAASVEHAYVGASTYAAEADGYYSNGPGVPSGIRSIASNVTLKNLVVEKGTGNGLDIASAHSGWRVENCVFRLFATKGMRNGGGGSVIKNTRFTSNGQYGIGNGGANTFDGVEIDHNNTHKYAKGDTGGYWGAGGAKFSAYTGTSTSHLVVKNSIVHDNEGDGLWTDVNQTGSVFDGNHIFHNQRAGVNIEISTAITVTNNLIENNGWMGIRILSGVNHLIRYNTVKTNGGWGVDLRGVSFGIPSQIYGSQTGGRGAIQNLKVLDNEVYQKAGYSGLTAASEADAATEWKGTTWHLPASACSPSDFWMWLSTTRTGFSGWLASHPSTGESKLCDL
jgi:hypothetical protein